MMVPSIDIDLIIDMENREFENRELQPEARTTACLETLPKISKDDEFEDYFTEIFNAVCNNQGPAGEDSILWTKFELPGPPTFTMDDVTALIENKSVYVELKDIFGHTQTAAEWLSRVNISQGSNQDAEDADEEVLRAFLLIHDVESLPFLEDFCNSDKKNLEMVQWIMQPMIQVLQEGSKQLYLIHRRKWYTRRGDGEAQRARLALAPGFAVRGRRQCPAIPTMWLNNEEEDESSLSELGDEIEIERLMQAWLAKWPSVENLPDLETYCKGIVSVVFHSPEIAHIEPYAQHGFRTPLFYDPSFTEADILALPSSKPEVWKEMKEILDHAKVVDAWLRQTVNGDPVDMSDEEKWSALIVNDANMYPVLLEFGSEDQKNREILKWIMRPIEGVLEACTQPHFLFRQKKWMAREQVGQEMNV